jgi:hypothetical protein
VGILLPIVAWLTGELLFGPFWRGWIVACVAVGEIVDRLEFYAELDVPTPKGQIALDLRSHIAALPARRGGAP